MREIKFRGKNIDSGEWVYGHYISHQMNVGNHNLRHLIITNYQMSEQHVVDPETIGQFTEKLDESFTEIYEGDIIENGYIGEVVFGDFDCDTEIDHNNSSYDYSWQFPGWHVKPFHPESIKYFSGDTYKLDEFGKIIGNIIDNPELKVKK